jgi:3-oxoacyl-[acyl-carrier protein] reductase
MTMNLQGKTAVVTGGGRGVGRAVALALAEHGCDVAINYHQARQAAEETAAQIRSRGVKAICLQGDTADDGSCRAMMDAVCRELGRIDILVNNAATTRFISHGDLDQVTGEIWDRIFAVNVRGPFQCVRAARRYLEQSDDGVVVNVASIAGIVGNGSSIPYCASKAALITLTMSLARALGPKIRVNAVAPGFIETDWTRDGLGAHYDAARQASENRAVLRKVCQPADVADAVLSLISGSKLVTGQTLVCDGGFLLGS